jgi:hypothetical protein
MKDEGRGGDGNYILDHLLSSFRLPPSSFVLAVGVGIEPTYRVFQTRANPSQLSDLVLVFGLRSLVFEL